MARAVLYTTDLACSSAFSGAAARQGVEAHVAMSAAALLQRAEGADLVVLDLASPGIGEETFQRLRSLEPAPKLVAFAPHVHEQKLQQAQQAGCDTVWTRGQFHRELDSLLGGLESVQWRDPGRR